MKNKKLLLLILIFLVVILFLTSLFVGSSNMTFLDAINGLFNRGPDNYILIMRRVRLPRAIGALVVGASLGLSGVIMQTMLSNDMASPSTLGVSNAATFGANLSIIVIAQGFLDTGNNLDNYFLGNNIYATSFIAFIFALASTLIILSLCKSQNYKKETVILSGVAIGAIWSALTSLLQFYATDVSLSAAVIWSFGDISRTNYNIDLLIAIITLISFIFFMIKRNEYNAILSGDDIAKSSGVKVDSLRFISLLLSSLITAVVVANLGIIGFVGLISPHISKILFTQNHKYSIPGSLLIGSILLLVSNILSRIIGSGSQIPVGIITSIIGAPFFLYLIFRKRRVYS